MSADNVLEQHRDRCIRREAVLRALLRTPDAGDAVELRSRLCALLHAQREVDVATDHLVAAQGLPTVAISDRAELRAERSAANGRRDTCIGFVLQLLDDVGALHQAIHDEAQLPF